MFPYSRAVTNGRLWYYGFEPTASLNAAEGSRTVDVTQAPLYPYIQQTGGVEICPSFPYKSPLWMPKYQQGAVCNYGINMISFPAVTSTGQGANVASIPHPSRILLFGDCANVNTIEAPASTSNPRLEEFYEFDSSSATTHFRHGGFANILFLDGHEEKFTMYPGTLAKSLPSANVGRFTPSGGAAGSTYLK
jgi:prepilin-type processing-associated H-X9-DG protein